MDMNRVPAFIGGMALVAAVAGNTARANLLVNGGLETSKPVNQYNLVFANPSNGSSVLPGWTVTTGTIDVVPSSYFQNTQGNFSVDLIGTPGLGGISQTVATTPGTQYLLTFDFSINPENLTNEFGTTKIMKVSATGGGNSILNTQQYSDTAGTRTFQNMQYTQESFTFTANSNSTTITLAALLPLNLPPGMTGASAQCGPVIDNLDLEPAPGASQLPEPGTLAVMGLGGMLLLRRRRSS